MKKQSCNRKGCNNKLGKDCIKTDVGNFCSEKCRKEIEMNVFKFLMYPTKKVNQIKK